MNEPQDLFDSDRNASGDWNEWTRAIFCSLPRSDCIGCHAHKRDLPIRVADLIAN